MLCCTSWRILFPILALTGLVTPAMAEESGAKGRQRVSANTTTAPKPVEAGIKARGERQLRQLKYSGWRKLCFRPSDKDMVCRTTITGLTETGEEMLRVDLIEAGAGKGARLQIFVPPMLFLEAGIRVSVVQGDTVNIPFTWCFSNVCVAAHAVDAAFIRQMKTGLKMTLKVVDARISTVMTSLPLDRFAAVNQGPPDLTFGRSLEGMQPKM
jgi:invasion protein IalB